MERLIELIKAWDQYVYDRNLYSFGDKEISVPDFTRLAKETFEITKKAKEEYIYKKTIPEDPYETLLYLTLISFVSQYTIYDNMNDESDGNVFTVTCIVAHGLTEFARNMDTVIISENEERTYEIDEKVSAGDLFIRRDSFRFDPENITDGEMEKVYRYNVYDADFSELEELAQKINIL